MSLASCLEISAVSRVFGPVTALENVSLRVEPRSVHAIIGENGAGKSTLMNIICGNVRPSAGELRLGGKPVHFNSPMDAQQAGIAIAPQEIHLVPALSAAENVILGRHSHRRGVIDRTSDRQRAMSALGAIDPQIDPDRRAGELTIAQQQLVQIARAISTGARILIFDEPTAALTDTESERLFTFIRRFRADGGSCLYISHRLEEILHLADIITVLRDGRHVGELVPAQTTKDEMVRAMAGRAVSPLGRREERPTPRPDKPVLRVATLGRRHEFDGVSFTLAQGEVLGIGGLIGSGRTELARCIFGITRADEGTVEVFGRVAAVKGPADAIRAGLVYLPEERKRDGIFPLLSVAENITLPTLGRSMTVFGIAWKDIVARADGYIRSIPIKTSSPYQRIAQLSGGNQQKAILARWLMSSCRILILDEPTRGIDVKAKREIQLLLRDLAREGLSIIYISSELQEILDVSDRVLLMHEGRARGIVPVAGATQESLLALAMS
jgi:ribose transport system ATP-binding protein